MHTKCQKQAFWRWYGQRSKCAVLQQEFETFTVRNFKYLCCLHRIRGVYLVRNRYTILSDRNCTLEITISL